MASLKIKKGDNEIILNWNKVAERVQKFIEDGTYLTYKEKSYRAFRKNRLTYFAICSII